MRFFMYNFIRNAGLFLLLFCGDQLIAQGGFNVDVLPQNIGGKAEFKRIFDEQLQYPSRCLQQKIGGEVVCNFTVNKDSTVSKFKLISCGVPELDQEALRLFRYYQWIPAMKNGISVGTDWSVTFSFNPSKYSKICKERGYEKYEYYKEHSVDTTMTIYDYPEQMPMYSKGNYALHDFIRENLEYPKQAQLANLQGKVVLGFVVEPNGTITNISIEHSVGGGCDQEAIRVLQLIKWYPAIHADKYVRARMSMPFFFILNEDFKDNSSGEQK